MADVIASIFRNKKVNPSKLIEFGFERNNSDYIYTRPLMDGAFNLTVKIDERDEASAQVIDSDNGELYTLHLAPNAVGSFVGKIRSEYEAALSEIAQNCFEPDIFKSDQTKKLICHVRDTYGDELEFLWPKFPDNAIWRRKDTKKWYCALLTVSKRKLGINSDETAEIIDLRVKPENMTSLIDNKLYFPGWHMNKKSWYTIILDGSVPFEEICRRIAESYDLAK